MAIAEHRSHFTSESSPIETYATQLLPLEEELRETAQQFGAELSHRDFHIVERLWGLRCPRVTLEQVGQELSVTRERVRQLRDRIAPRLRDAFLRCEPYSIILLHELVMSDGGLCDFTALQRRYATLCPPTDYSVSSFLHLIVDISAISDVRLIDGNLLAARAIDNVLVAAARNSLQNALSEQWTLQIDDLVSVLPSRWPCNDDELVQRHARLLAVIEGHEVLPGVFSANKWSRIDFARFVLEHEGRALHFSEIAARIGVLARCKLSATGINGILNTSATFVRVGAGDFALAAWGAKRYGRFDEVIERYLTSGRIAEHVDAITSALLQQYTVAPMTIPAMLGMSRHKFTHLGGGYWTVTGYSPIVDTSLIAILLEIFRDASRPLTPSEVHACAASMGHTKWTYAEVRRALYVSNIFQRSGHSRDRRFQAPPSEERNK